MNPNIRFAAIILGFAVLAAVIYVALAPGDGPVTDEARSGSPVPAPDAGGEDEAPLDVSRAEVAVDSPGDDGSDPHRALTGEVIAGRVVDQNGDGVGGASMAAYQANIGAIRSRSEADGTFVIDGLEDGAYRVSAAKEGFNESFEERVSSGTEDVLLVLTPLSRVSGHVVDADTGEVIEGAEVAYLEYPPDDEGHWRRMLDEGRPGWRRIAGADGSYVLDDVLSGKAVGVAARADGYAPGYTVVGPLEPGAEQSVEVALLPGARIEGIVTAPDNSPVANATIHVLDNHDPGPEIAVTNGEGEFTITDVSEGSISLLAKHGEYTEGTADVTVRVGRVERVTIEMGQGGVVAGAVYLGNRPMPGQEVILSQLRRDGFRQQTRTDSEGQYEVRGVPEGTIGIQATISFDSQDAEPLGKYRDAVVESGRVTQVDFHFPEALGVIEGVITVNGVAPEKATVNGMVNTPTGMSSIRGQVSGEGYYRFENVMPGEIRLTIEATTGDDNELRKNLMVNLGPNETLRRDVELVGQMRITGRVLNAQDGMALQVMIVSGEVDQAPETMEAFTQLEQRQLAAVGVAEDGTFSISSLEPGTYTAVAVEFPTDGGGGVFLDSVRTATAPLVVGADGSGEVEISF